MVALVPDRPVSELHARKSLNKMRLCLPPSGPPHLIIQSNPTTTVTLEPGLPTA